MYVYDDGDPIMSPPFNLVASYYVPEYKMENSQSLLNLKLILFL